MTAIYRVMFLFQFCFDNIAQFHIIFNTGSLGELSGFASQAELPYFTEISYGKLIKDFYPYYAEMFIKEGNQIDKEGLERFLTQIKMIADNVPAAENTDKDETAGSLRDMGVGECSLSVSVLKGMTYQWAAEHFSLARNIDGELTVIGDWFVPYSLMGINNASMNKELAMEFISEVLSEEIQTVYFLDEGFPVNQESAQQWQNTDEEFTAGLMSPTSNEVVHISYPDQEERNQLFGYIRNLKTPVYQDDILLEMIVSEAGDYFKGVESVEKTVEKIINKANLYMEE